MDDSSQRGSTERRGQDLIAAGYSLQRTAGYQNKRKQPSRSIRSMGWMQCEWSGVSGAD